MHCMPCHNFITQKIIDQSKTCKCISPYLDSITHVLNLNKYENRTLLLAKIEIYNLAFSFQPASQMFLEGSKGIKKVVVLFCCFALSIWYLEETLSI